METEETNNRGRLGICTQIYSVPVGNTDGELRLLKDGLPTELDSRCRKRSGSDFNPDTTIAPCLIK